jgi:hypothetical protein
MRRPYAYNLDHEPIDPIEAGALLMDGPARHVGATAINDDIHISTVFLVIDHRMLGEGPPVLYETMIFGGPFDQSCERYTTREAAEAGHERWVAQVREAVKPLA